MRAIVHLRGEQDRRGQVRKRMVSGLHEMPRWWCVKMAQFVASYVPGSPYSIVVQVVVCLFSILIRDPKTI